MEKLNEFLKSSDVATDPLSELEKKQRTQSIRRIADLPSLGESAEMRDAYQSLISADQTPGGVGITPPSTARAIAPFSLSFTKPYTSSSRPHFLHPFRAGSFQTLWDVFNPFSFAKEGVISLSSITGQFGTFVYPHYGSYSHSGLKLFYTEQSGEISQKVVFENFGLASKVTVRVIVALPENDHLTDDMSICYNSLTLFPGPLTSHLQGMVGVEADLQVYITLGNDVPLVGATFSTNFLHVYRTEAATSGAYEREPQCELSFELPASVKEFTVNVKAIVNSITANHYDVGGFALIDFRDDSLIGSYPIMPGLCEPLITDHKSLGPISVEQISVRVESYVPVTGVEVEPYGRPAGGGH